MPFATRSAKKKRGVKPTVADEDIEFPSNLTGGGSDGGDSDSEGSDLGDQPSDEEHGFSDSDPEEEDAASSQKSASEASSGPGNTDSDDHDEEDGDEDEIESDDGDSADDDDGDDDDDDENDDDDGSEEGSGSSSAASSSSGGKGGEGAKSKKPPVNPETGFPMDPTVLRGYVGKKPLYEGGVARDEDSESEAEVDGFSRNTVGNVPMHWYDDEDHIGYDLEGNRITRKQRQDELDRLIAKLDDPDYWRTVRDETNDRDVKLTDTELDLLRRIRDSKFPDPEFDPNPEYTDWFEYDGGDMPLTARPEPKSRFIPSRHEHRRIMKIVRAIRAGRIVLDKPKPKAPETYMLWDDENPTLTKHQQQLMSLPAPKMALPGHAASYNPPDEYLMTPEEIKAWEAMDPEDRPHDFIPQKFPNLRSVPIYKAALPERFERCLDLYMAPRARKLRLNVDPKSLIPKLPKPQDLRPYPNMQAMTLKGHRGRVRSVSVSPSGSSAASDLGSALSVGACSGFAASGGDDGVVRVWEIRSGRCVYTIRVGWGQGKAAPTDLSGRKAEAARKDLPSDHEDLYDGAAPEGDETMRSKDVVDAVAWNPNPEYHLLAIAAGRHVYIVMPKGATEAQEEASRTLLAEPTAASAAAGENGTPVSGAEWRDATREERKSGVLAVVTLTKRVRSLDWHRRGTYLASVSPAANTSAVAVHDVSRRVTQTPFRRLKGTASATCFHPSKAVFFLATQRHVRVYDLVEQRLVRKLMAGTQHVSTMAVHPSGDHLIVGGLDRRVAWFDLDMGATAYKVLRHHREAVRSVTFHDRLPLFCSASDEGTINVCHGQVFSDLQSDPLIVPLKRLRGHKVTGNLGVMSVAFHRTQPWIVSGGADGTVRIWVDV